MKTPTRPYYHSSSFKMAVLFTALLGLAVALLAYFLYDLTRQNFIRETRAVLDAEIVSILEIQSLRPDYDVATLIRHRQGRAGQTLYQLLDPQGDIVAGYIHQLPDVITPIAEGVLRMNLAPEMVTGVEVQESRLVAAKVHTFPDGSRLLVARDIDAIAASHVRLQWLGGISIALMLIVVLTSFFLSVFVVKRINIIAATANDIIDTGDLSRRISIDTRWDDLSNLAQILNTLFERVEKLMKDVRRVSDNIAHDLRTPLTRLRNQLESLRDHPPVKAQADQLIDEADHLLATFNSLLRIANIEAVHQRKHFADVAMRPLINDVLELYAPLAEDKAITISETLGEASVVGDRDLLFQMLANVMDNAIKFTPHQGTITLSLSTDAKRGKTVISIADSGPGIPQEETDNVFTRFYRTEQSRHTPGSGLGLSLVAAVVELHNGTILLEDNAPGLRVQISL